MTWSRRFPRTLLTDDHTSKDSATGEIAGPVFLPLRDRPATAGGRTAVSDKTADERRAEAVDRNRRSAGEKLCFRPGR
jgi:hypothetical protein